MGYALLWLENLAAALLLAATLLAFAGKIRRRWLSRSLGLLVVLIPMALYAAAIVSTSWLIERGLLVGIYRPLLMSAVCYSIGGVWMLLRGLGREPASSASIRAGHWPGGRLAAAFAVVLVLHAMTFWSLDAMVKQQLMAVRAEAGSLALSVAPPRVADSENAALVYQRVFEVLDTAGWPDVWHEALEARQIAVPKQGDFDYSSAELREFLAERAGELAVIREAAVLPECRFERDYERLGFDAAVPERIRVRQASQLLAVDARHKAATGDVGGAMENINAIFAVSRHAASEPLLISTLASMAIDYMGIQTLEAILASAPVTAQDLAILDLDESVPYRRLAARSFRMEEAAGLSLFCTTEGGPFDPMYFEHTELEGIVKASGIAAMYRVFHLAEDLASYREHFRVIHTASSKPYYVTRNQWTDIKGASKSEGVGALTALVLPDPAIIVERVQRAEAMHRAAVLGVAASRYQARHGRFPEALDDLTPELVHLLPVDPFDGEPMRFRRTGEGCVFYSIGPDLVDDNGSPLVRSDQSGDICFVVASRSELVDTDSPVSDESRPDDSQMATRP
jgi:hypothetical protein